MDITVVSPHQQKAIERAGEEPGYALKMRFEQKWRKYVEPCRAEGIIFEPLPVETFDGWGTEVVSHMFGRLSILLQKSNSSLMVNRVPVHPAPQLSGEL